MHPIEYLSRYTAVIFGTVAGLITRNDKTKLQILNEEAVTENAILIALTESHITEHHSDSEVQINEYTSYVQTEQKARRKEV